MLFVIIFALLTLQILMGLLQVRLYQKTIKKWLGKGILGIGQKKGLLRPGELLIVVYNRYEDQVINVQSMKGYTIFANFREIKEYTGVSLDELRRKGIEKDAQEMKRYRKKHPYDPSIRTKKKGALIQAVEAIDGYLRREAEKDPEQEE